LVAYGGGCGPSDPFDAQRLHAGGSLYLTRPGLPHYVATAHELRSRAAEVFGWIADRRLEVRIGARYPLEQARHAQEDLAARKTTGKVLLMPR
jgi:NADPH2:quinone reductase